MGSEASIPVRLTAQVGASPEPAALASAAHALCDAGRTMEAEAIARWLVQQHPQFSGARIVLGRVLFEQDRLNEAADVLRATTIQYPASVAAYRWLAEVLVRQGLWARARAVLNQAALLSPANRRIGQLQRLAGQSAERGAVVAEDSTTRAMNLPSRQAPPLPPIPAQGLSRTERRNGLSEEDPTPAGVAPPETPLYARSDFAAHIEAAPPTPPPSTELVPSPPRRATLEWPAPAVLATVVPDSSYRESAVINVLSGPTGDPTAVEPTPSVIWKGIPMLDQHWRQRWQKGAALAVGLLATAGAGFAGWWLFKPGPGVSRNPSLAQQVAQAPAPSADLLQGLAVASPDALLATIQKATAAGTDPATVVAKLAHALLVVEYGVRLPAPPPPSSLRDPTQADADLAAEALIALGDGHLERARSLVQGRTPADDEGWWLPFAQARLFQRLGNGDAARERLEQITTSTVVTAVLAAELALDDGKPSVALQRLSALGEQSNDHPRVAGVSAEAQEALTASAATPSACADALPPNQRLSCIIRTASQARRHGRRDVAASTLEKARADDVTDPRALGHAVVALGNLGLAARAQPFAQRLRQLSAAAFPGRAWADLALALAAGPAGAASDPPGAAISPETRLLAARAAFARGGRPSLAVALGKMGDSAIAADDDLRWWRLLTRFDAADAGRMSVRLMRSKKSLGPVGTFVAGLLAENSRHLTAHWMGLALAAPGHGDRCWAASLYARAQRNLGDDPAAAPAYRTLTATGGCAMND